MALRINQDVTTRDGFIVSAGTIVKFQTIFLQDAYEFHCNMKFYKDQDTFDNGGNNYYPTELVSLGYVKSLTYGEFTGLTPVAVNTYLKDYLETIYTGGTIDIVI